MAIASKQVCQIALIVEDLDKVVAHYREAFSLPEPRVFYLPKPDATPAFTDGKPGDYSDCRMAVFALDNLILEITQPGDSDSPWRRWLEAHGPGVQHLGFMIPEENKADAFQALTKAGSNVYHAGFYPDLTYTFVAGFDAFGVDFNIKWETDNRAKIAQMLANPQNNLTDL